MTHTPSITGSGDGTTSMSPAHSPWIVLVVDDEPEVHEVTRLVLGDLTFCGIPVELNSVYSSRQAKSFLKNHPDTAVTLLDVVMETDHAGLELVHFIREELGDEDNQIVLRTGQPGKAPEKSVVLNYGINGYFLKTEITAQKLHSIIISSLRNFQHIKNVKQSRYVFRGGYTEIPSNRIARLREHIISAISNNSLPVVAQPQIRLSTNEITGIYCKPEISLSGVPQNELVQCIARINDEQLLLQLDAYLLKQIARAIVHWIPKHQDAVRLSMPVFSANLNCSATAELIDSSLSRLKLNPDMIGIELQDTAFISHSIAIFEFTDHIQSLGIHTGIQHSGTHMMSIRNLRRMQQSNFVIPELLINSLTKSDDTAIIIRSIIALAQTIGLSVIAEGVRSQQQLEFLTWEECEIVRGSLIAEPLPIEQCARLMALSNSTKLH